MNRKSSRRTHPHLKLASRENTKGAHLDAISAIKISMDHNGMVEIHVNNNNKQYSKVNNIIKPASVITKVDRNEEELLSSSSEDE